MSSLLKAKEGFFQKHNSATSSTNMTLERAASHIKVTSPLIDSGYCYGKM